MTERRWSGWIALAEIISAAAVVISRFYVTWERAFSTYEAGVLSSELFDGWNTWFISVATRDPAFVWPMVRDSQDWGPRFIQHVDRALGFPTGEPGGA